MMEKMSFLNKFKLPAVLFLGRLFSFMPDDRVDLVTVIGKPLQLPQILNPSDEEVREWHGKYISLLRDVFNRHKEKLAADPKAELVIM
mmetsp:Transcript_46744/g.63626  ORF Transcript_46744/g.63626 Transcript_46744/m.63626 type:complete len:88 (+) Transcript_46744:3-266(+)